MNLLFAGSNLVTFVLSDGRSPSVVLTGALELGLSRTPGLRCTSDAVLN